MKIIKLIIMLRRRIRKPQINISCKNKKTTRADASLGYVSKGVQSEGGGVQWMGVVLYNNTAFNIM